MILDDDKPDYFLESEDTASPSGAPASPSAKPGDTIDFGSPSTTAENTGAGHDDVKPRHGKMRKVLAWTVFVGAVILGAVFYLRYCTPYVTDARLKCYVVNVEKRGLIFKTYEADVVSESAVTDTARLYSRDYSFSIEDRELARKLRDMQGSGRPVMVSYEKYYGTLPWRGSSKLVVVGMEPVKPVEPIPAVRYEPSAEF